MDQNNTINQVGNDAMGFVDQLMGGVRTSFTNATDYLPQLIGALVILIVGYFIAKIVKRVLVKVLRAVKFNDVADKVGINSRLAKAGLKSDASGLMGKLGYWMIMFTTLTLFFSRLGLESISTLFTDVVSYIPRLLVGCILLIVGMFLANFVKDLVIATLKGGDFENPNLVGNIAYGGIMFLVVSMVLNQIGIGGDIVNTLVTSVLGGLSIATAIAFGLGGKDWAAAQIKKVSKMD